MTASWVDSVRTAKAEIDARHATQRGRTVGEALADPIAVVRVQWNGRAGAPLLCRYNVHAYTAAYQRVPLDRATQELYLTGLMQHWPKANWLADWDYRLADDRLLTAPRPSELGGIPDLDGTFGPAHNIPTMIGAPA